MASHHARAIGRCGLGELVAVSDPDPAARQRFLSSHPECRAYESLTQLIEAAQPQVAHICTPGRTHFRLATQLISSGCHLYVEKPFAMRVAEADKLFRAADARGVRITAGHQLLFERPTLTAEALLPSVGRIVRVESYFAFHAARHAGLSATEQLLDILPHPTYLLLRFVARAAGGRAASVRPAVTLSEAGDVTLWVESDGVTGSLFVTLAGRPVDSYVRIVGTNGTLHADYVRGTVQRLIGPGTSGIDKLLGPYRLSRQLFAQTTKAMSSRAFDRRRRYPGLVEAFEAFYAEVSGGPVAVSRENIRATTQVVELVADALDQRSSTNSVDSIQGNRPSVIVTGGTGFLGKAVVQQLATHGAFRVRVLARREPAPWDRVAGVEYRTCDLSDEPVEDLLQGATTIVHCAAETGGGWQEHEKNSITAVENLIESAVRAGVTQLVHVSSVAVLGRQSRAPISEDSPFEPDPRAAGPYVWGKVESERTALQLSEARQLNLRVVRPGAIVDSRRFEPPGRLGKRLGNIFLAVGGRNEKLGVVELDLVAGIIAWIVEHFEESPTTVNTFDAELPTRRQLVDRLRARNPDLRVIWLPRFMVGPLALALRIIQRLLRPRRSPIDIRKAFDQRSYSVEVVRELIEQMSGASGRLAGSNPEILVSAM